MGRSWRRGQILGRSWAWDRCWGIPGYGACVESFRGMGQVGALLGLGQPRAFLGMGQDGAFLGKGADIGAFLGMGKTLGRSWLWDRCRVVPGYGASWGVPGYMVDTGVFLCMGHV